MIVNRQILGDWSKSKKLSKIKSHLSLLLFLKMGQNWKCFSKIKFVFPKKATKIDEIFTVDMTLTTSTVKISSIFVAFLENMNFNQMLS